MSDPGPSADAEPAPCSRRGSCLLWSTPILLRAVGKLNHPNVVRAHDAREGGEMRFLVMEYVDGLDLGRLAERLGPLPVADACELIRQAALGLGASPSSPALPKAGGSA